MLVGENLTHVYWLNIWSNLEEVQNTETYPPLGPNAEGGVCFVQRGEQVEAGIYYETASGRRILQFYDVVYLLGMDESWNLKTELEEYFQTAFEKTQQNIEYCFFTVDRPLEGREGPQEWGVSMGYFMHTYSPNHVKNELILSIFSHLTEGGGKIKQQFFPLSLFDVDDREEKQLYDFYANVFGALREEERREIAILTKIAKEVTKC